MKKFIFGIMFAVAACISFSSCGQSEGQQHDTDSTAVDTAEVVVDSLAVDSLNVATDSTAVAE